MVAPTSFVLPADQLWCHVNMITWMLSRCIDGHRHDSAKDAAAAGGVRCRCGCVVYPQSKGRVDPGKDRPIQRACAGRKQEALASTLLPTEPAEAVQGHAAAARHHAAADGEGRGGAWQNPERCFRRRSASAPPRLGICNRWAVLETVVDSEDEEIVWSESDASRPATVGRRLARLPRMRRMARQKPRVPPSSGYESSDHDGGDSAVAVLLEHASTPVMDMDTVKAALGRTVAPVRDTPAITMPDKWFSNVGNTGDDLKEHWGRVMLTSPLSKSNESLGHDGNHQHDESEAALPFEPMRLSHQGGEDSDGDKSGNDSDFGVSDRQLKGREQASDETMLCEARATNEATKPPSSLPKEAAAGVASATAVEWRQQRGWWQKQCGTCRKWQSSSAIFCANGCGKFEL